MAWRICHASPITAKTNSTTPSVTAAWAAEYSWVVPNPTKRYAHGHESVQPVAARHPNGIHPTTGLISGASGCRISRVNAMMVAETPSIRFVARLGFTGRMRPASSRLTATFSTHQRNSR